MSYSVFLPPYGGAKYFIITLVAISSYASFAGEKELHDIQLKFLHQLTESMLEKPTFELYRNSSTQEFVGSHVQTRAGLDYTFHVNYTVERQQLQDEIIDFYLSQGVVKKRPKLIFSAGPMGVGKTHTLLYLDKIDYLILSDYILIDMDQIRDQLPETKSYIQKDPQTAGYKTNKESGYIQEIVFSEALKSGKNIIVDSSLRDAKWHQSLFLRIRKDYPQYQIEIFFVQANKETIFQRALDRTEETGRLVPKEVLEESFDSTYKSVEVLKKYTNRTLYFNNNNSAPELAGEYH